LAAAFSGLKVDNAHETRAVFDTQHWEGSPFLDFERVDLPTDIQNLVAGRCISHLKRAGNP
jgi:hypothetical protein